MQLYKNGLPLAKQNRTLRAIVNFVEKKQAVFFRTHEWQLLEPLKYESVAKHLKVHISTVSRNISRLQFLLDSRLYSFKSLFPTVLNDNTPTITIKYIIYFLLKDRPFFRLTDAKITNAINYMGYNISRRTINKYRREVERDMKKYKEMELTAPPLADPTEIFMMYE